MSRVPQHRPLERHRVQAAINELQKRIDTINEHGLPDDPDSQHAAALRGKRRGYVEAQAILRALHDEVPMPHRWWPPYRRTVAVREDGSDAQK